MTIERSSTSTNIVDAGNGDDTITASGTTGSFTLTGGSGTNTLNIVSDITVNGVRTITTSVARKTATWNISTDIETVNLLG